MSKEFLLLAPYLLLLAYLLISRRAKLLRYAVLAFCLALIWTVAASSLYNYNTTTVSLFGINLYALLGWSLGLLIGYILYSFAQRFVRCTTWWQKLLLFNALYLPLLIVVETIAYHYFNVVNVATTNYAGLPLCDCIHAPLWMQIAYFAIGSIFFMLTRLIKTLRTNTLETTPEIVSQPE